MRRPDRLTFRKAAVSLGKGVYWDGTFSSRHRTGEGFLPSAKQVLGLRLRNNTTEENHSDDTQLAKKPLTRPAPAGESAGAGHPLPRGEGCSFTRWIAIATLALTAFVLSVGSAFAQGMASEDVSPTGDIDLGTVPPDQIISAVATARKAIRQRTDSAEGYLHLAIALRSGGDQQGASEAIERALALNPQLPGAWLQKGLISINGGTLRAATGFFEKAVETDPKSIPARLELSAMLFRSGDFKGAQEQVESALRFDPQNANALGGLGYIQLQQGQIQAAVETFRKAIAAQPRFPEAKQNLGNALMRLEDWAGARQAFEDAIKDEPDAIPAVYGLGTVLRHLGERAQAAAQFAKAKEMLQMVQALARAQGEDNNGVRMWNSGDLAGASDAFRTSIAAHPAYAEAHNNLGGVLWQQKNFKEATEEFTLAIRADPKFAKAHNNLGNALMVAGNLQEAMKHFQTAVSLEPGFATGHFSLGLALAQQGQKDLAEKEYRDALILSPDLATAHLELGLLLASSKRVLPPEARAEIEEGVRLNPELRAALPPAISSALAVPPASSTPLR